MAGRYDLTIEQGATFTKTFTWKQSGAAVDLTSYHARMQIRETKDATTALVDLDDQTKGGIVLGGVAGTIAVTISATATAALSFDTAFYDLEMVLSTVVTRLLEGEVYLSKEVTR